MEPAARVEDAAASSPSRAGLVALTGSGILWGTIGVVVRLLQDTGMTSASVACWRFVCAIVVLLPVLGRSKLQLLRDQLRRPARPMAVAVTSLTFQLLYFFAVHDIGAGVATLVTLGIAPVILHVSEAFGARAVPPVRTMVVLALALGGLALVSTGDVSAVIAPHPVRGLLESLGSGLTYAVSTAWSRPLVERMSGFSITFLTAALGLVLLLPVLAVSGWHTPHTALTVSGAVWLGVVTTVVAYGLFYFGLRSTPGSTAMIVTLLEPVTAFALAALLLGEPLTANNLAGGALVLLAVVVLYLRPSRPPPTRRSKRRRA